MKVTLAGYNVDTAVLERIGAADKDILTPETFSAAYARISRSKKDITTLRQEARQDVLKARKSNRSIIFKMGHHSVAEHAVFNFDIINVSRLALEEIEQFRLGSYTEKSQRYVTLDGDYVIPEEIKGHPLLSEFKDTIRQQNEFYRLAFDRITEHLSNLHPDKAGKRNERLLLEGRAKEDARYILSLATQGQMGMTINARTAEYMLRRFHLSQRQEVKELGRRIHEQLNNVAPSIILFAEPSPFEINLKENFAAHFTDIPPADKMMAEASLIDVTAGGENTILALFLSLNQATDFSANLKRVKGWSRERKRTIFLDLYDRMEFFDSPPREFEFVDFTFQAVISAANYAQLKRHRMASLIVGEYDPDLGNTLPDLLQETGLEKRFYDIIKLTNNSYRHLMEDAPSAADYILTNSHRRPIVMKMNLRELYHFVRLRDDEHAQWDIRQLASHLGAQVRQKMPLAALLLCGKSEYCRIFEEIFSKKPLNMI